MWFSNVNVGKRSGERPKMPPWRLELETGSCRAGAMGCSSGWEGGHGAVCGKRLHMDLQPVGHDVAAHIITCPRHPDRLLKQTPP